MKLNICHDKSTDNKTYYIYTYDKKRNYQSDNHANNNNMNEIEK